MTQYYRCDNCHYLSDKVSWSDTGYNSGISRHETITDVAGNVSSRSYHDAGGGVRSMIPCCIHCHSHATPLSTLANALVDIAKPENV